MSGLLRPYQREDVEFSLGLSPVRLLNLNDTGLGKTIETIETIRLHPRHDRVVVMCGKSLLGKWRDEFVKWGHTGLITVVSGDSGSKAKRYEMIGSWASGVLVVNYETMRAFLLEYGRLFKCDWFVIDEAHHIKNRKSGLTELLRKFIYAENRVLLTATPTDGNPADYWALLAFLFPNRYTSYWRFADKYCNLVPNGFTAKAYSGPKNLDELKAELAPFTIQRQKRDVLSELPPVTVERVDVTLDKTSLKHYKAIKTNGLTKTDDGELIIADNSLAKMTRLRQLCSHPIVLGIGGNNSPKSDYLTEVIEGATRPVVVYSDFEEVVSHLSSIIPWPSVSITGQIKGKARDRAVAAVNGGQVKVCFITRAGGEGLDLIGADRLVFYDLPLSQIAYRQVMGRLDRIGQENPVLVTRLITKGSIEERVLALVESKVSYTDDMIIKELSAAL